MTIDGETFQRHLGRYRNYLVMLAHMKLSPALRSKISSSDIVQETLLKAHQNLGQFEGQTEAELAAWLRQILVRNLIDALRRFQSEARDIAREQSLEADAAASSKHLERWLASDESCPDRAAMHEEELLHLAQALASLPDEQREVVQWKHLQEWSVAKIAEHLGKSEASVAGLLRRGLQRLRELLGESA